MKKIRDWFQNLKIRNKILVCFIAVIALTMLTISLLYDAAFQSGMTGLANDSTQVIVQQANAGVENIINNVERQMDMLSADDNVKNFCDPSHRPGSSTELSMTRIGICDTFSRIKQTFTEVKGIALIAADNSFISNEMYKNRNESIVSEEWYADCLKSADRLTLLVNPVSRSMTYYDTVSYDDLLCLAKTVRNDNGDIIGVLSVDITLDRIEEVLSSVVLGKDGFVVIMDNREDLLYSPVNRIAPRIRSSWFSSESGIFEKLIDGERYQLIYKTSDVYDWKVIGVFSLSATLKQVSDTRLMLFIILGIVCLLAIAMALFFSSTIVKPLIKLQSLMTVAQDGDLAVRFNARYRDEIGSLGLAFNSLLDRMQKLIDMVYIEQKKKRYAELNALQAQIKPHFLYNTFDTIHWMAKKYGADDIIYVVRCLTNIFRIGLSKGSEIILLRDEIQHVDNYLRIQRIRYEDILDYSINTVADVEKLYVHKLILQPIVENAIYHGIKAKNARGRIDIDIFVKEQDLYLVVKDDGAGMDEDTLKKLTDSFASGVNSGSGYGMFNVNQRIVLTFGADYGLSIKSVKGEGTAVTIRYPVIDSPEKADGRIANLSLDKRREE